MAVTHFNTLEYVKLLLQADFSQKQAEGLNEAQMVATQALISHVATKFEMQAEFRNVRAEIQEMNIALRSEMQAEFRNVRAEMQEMNIALRSEMQAEFRNVRAEMQEMRVELRSEMKEMEGRLRHEIKDLEHRLERVIFKATLSTIGINFVLMALGVSALTLI